MVEHILTSELISISVANFIQVSKWENKITRSLRITTYFKQGVKIYSTVQTWYALQLDQDNKYRQSAGVNICRDHLPCFSTVSGGQSNST